MQDNNKDENKRQTTNVTNPDHKLQYSIFSRDEIKDTVKGFVLAWLKGDINLEFPNAEEIMDRAKLAKEKMNFNQATEEEIKSKTVFNNLVSTCVGTKKTSSEKQEKAVSELFSYILHFRSGHRLKGTFIRSIDIEERFHKIEEELESTKNIVYELTMFVKQLEPRHE